MSSLTRLKFYLNRNFCIYIHPVSINNEIVWRFTAEKVLPLTMIVHESTEYEKGLKTFFRMIDKKHKYNHTQAPDISKEIK